MRHHVKISVSRKPQTDSDLSCRDMTVRERMLRFLLGDKRRIMILVPGESVEEVSICEAEEGGSE